MPTADEYARFMGDKDPKKREKLVDELLDRKEVTKGEAWGYLAVHGDRVFVRDLESVRAFHWPARTTP